MSGEENVKVKVGVTLLLVSVWMTAWLPARKYGLVSHVGVTLLYNLEALTK